MNGRAPDQENATAPNNPFSVPYEPGEQMALLPELEAAPTAPKAGTLADRLLRMFAAGERLTHPEFDERTGSWRLSAVVFELGLLGWCVASVRIPAPSTGNPDRSISRYWLAARHVGIARQLHASGASSEGAQ